MQEKLVINGAIWNKNIVTFGERTVTNIAMEECAELIQALSKSLRVDCDSYVARNHVIEEIADVYLCLETMCSVFKIKPWELQDVVNFKQERQWGRIQAALNGKEEK